MSKSRKHVERVVMTPAQLWAGLEARYPKKEYALLSQVRNGTGFTRQVRTADAVALSLWPSRGLDCHGFEIKSYRGDWVREKDNPEKAEEIAQYCDFWWLVVTDLNIAPVDEVPKNWGLLGPNADGTGLAIAKQAERLEARPMSKSFLAAMFRNMSDVNVPAASVAAKCEESYRKGIEEGEKRGADVNELHRLRKLEADVKVFETTCGFELANHYQWQSANPKKFGEAVKALATNSDRLKWQLQQLNRLADTTESAGREVRERMKIIENIADALGTPIQEEASA